MLLRYGKIGKKIKAWDMNLALGVTNVVLNLFADGLGPGYHLCGCCSESIVQNKSKDLASNALMPSVCETTPLISPWSFDYES